MKKILFAALAALAITSCTQNEIDGIDNGKNEKNLINFNSIVKKGSRAAIVELSNLQENGFYAYAYNTGSEDAGTGELTTVIMNKEKMTYTDPSWNSENNHYWPATEKLQFFAFYAPKTTSIVLNNTATNKYPEIKDYAIATTAANQEDLLVANVLNATKAKNSTVTFAFTHALTQVNFSAKPKEFKTGLTYTITSMTIKDVVNKGTYNYGNTPKWTPSTVSEDKSTYTIFTGSQDISTADAVNLNTEAFMLLPQVCNATILVTYTVTDADGQTLYTGTDKSVKTNMTWEPNKNIRYTIELTDDITPLSFDVDPVAGWGSEEPGATVTE